MKNRVVVVVPVYKETLTASETLAINQLKSVLNETPIVIVSPVGLKNKEAVRILDPVDIKYFDKKYFQSTRTYNHLLVNQEFYKTFNEFKYMLLYQLDCYIFRDDLEFWCNKEWDYIGAPWLSIPVSSKTNIISKLFRRFMLRKVGNGGLSLRNISSHIAFINSHKLIAKYFRENEDVFFGVIAPMFSSKFKVPNYREAISFAFETEPQLAYKLNNNQLPMACHAWEKHDPAFWSSYIG
ncbi:hypothetical protein SAMN06298216_4363 [Spirosomataceae bacterium TFI 002]|nr:hypothetical protein SAMN06298216_4363 [Spirosomataceae bacterium TFI 002]